MAIGFIAALGTGTLAAITVFGHILGQLVSLPFKNPVLGYFMFLGVVMLDVFFDSTGVWGFKFSLINSLLNLIGGVFGIANGPWNLAVLVGLVTFGGFRIALEMKHKAQGGM